MASENSTEIDIPELVATILLGLAAMAIAWSTFQAGLWGGQQDEAYTESVREANNAVDLLQAADSIRTLDQSLFVEAFTSGVCEEGDQGNPIACERLLSAMSKEGAAAVNAWLGTDQSTNPFESPVYLEKLYGQGEAAERVSEEHFADGAAANEHGDNYELASTILTAVLFFSGMAIVIDAIRLRWSLLALAGLFLISGIAYMLTLPLA